MSIKKLSNFQVILIVLASLLVCICGATAVYAYTSNYYFSATGAYRITGCVIRYNSASGSANIIFDNTNNAPVVGNTVSGIKFDVKPIDQNTLKVSYQYVSGTQIRLYFSAASGVTISSVEVVAAKAMGQVLQVGNQQNDHLSASYSSDILVVDFSSLLALNPDNLVELDIKITAA